jgi:hypothetical protein
LKSLGLIQKNPRGKGGRQPHHMDLNLDQEKQTKGITIFSSLILGLHCGISMHLLAPYIVYCGTNWARCNITALITTQACCASVRTVVCTHPTTSVNNLLPSPHSVFKFARLSYVHWCLD